MPEHIDLIHAGLARSLELQTLRNVAPSVHAYVSGLISEVEQIRADRVALIDQVERIQRVAAKRERRIPPEAHVQAVMDAWLGCFFERESAAFREHGTDNAALMRQARMGWAQSTERVLLIAKVGEPVVLEVEG